MCGSASVLGSILEASLSTCSPVAVLLLRPVNVSLHLADGLNMLVLLFQMGLLFGKMLSTSVCAKIRVEQLISPVSSLADRSASDPTDASRSFIPLGKRRTELRSRRRRVWRTIRDGREG